MKNFGKLAVLGAVLSASASLAFASPIALTGGLTIVGTDTTDDTFTTTSISFPAPVAPATTNARITGATGNLSFASTTPNTLGNMFGFTASTVNQTIFLASDPQGLGFELFNVAVFTSSYTPGFGTSLTIKGSGQFFDGVGDTPETGTFVLTSSDTTCTSTTCSAPDTIGFSFTPGATASSTPEPSSLILLGTGLVSAAGTFLRKRVTV